MDSNRSTRSLVRARQRARVTELGAVQADVVSRRQLYDLGLSRGEVRAEVRARRWRTAGRHCIVLHTGPLRAEGRRWAAIIEGGPRAFLDGESALVAAGLVGYEEHAIRVSVPRGARIRHRGSATNIRQTRRWAADDVETNGVPRARVPVAAVRAALWAVSDRQAALLLTMVVQQKLCLVEHLAAELMRVRRDRRRLMLNEVVLDLAGGVRSLSELDVVRGCRGRGLPTPDLQVLRRTPRRSYYLDVRWARWQVVLEVDGIQHAWAQNLVADALRHNTVAMDGDVVLRLPVLGLRVCPDEFFAQIEQALVRRGWTHNDAA